MQKPAYEMRISDWSSDVCSSDLPIERERGHSIDAAIASVDHGGMHLNLIDTPGYPDFRGPTLSALAAVETVAVVVDADGGIGYGTRRMMEQIGRASGRERVCQNV